MDCYMWRIPEGCYQSLEDQGCGTPTWFWIAAAVAGGLLLFGGSKKKSTTARKVRARRR